MFNMDATTELRSRSEVTREPRDTESGHAWFGGGSLEKYPQGQLAGDLSYYSIEILHPQVDGKRIHLHAIDYAFVSRSSVAVTCIKTWEKYSHEDSSQILFVHPFSASAMWL